MAPAKELTDEEILKIVEEAFDEAYEILYSEDGWKEEKKNDKGDVICSKKSKQGKRIWRVVAKIDCDAEKLSNKFRDTSDICEWNTTLTKHEILKHINKDVMVSYLVTMAGGPRDMVAARDIIMGGKSAFKNDAFLTCGQSVDFPNSPTTPRAVRAFSGPNGTAVKALSDSQCEFRWLLDCDYEGMVPRWLCDIAMPFALSLFVESVRTLAIQWNLEPKKNISTAI